TGKPIRTLAGPMGPVEGLAFSPDGRRLFGASHDRSIWVWQAETGERLGQAFGHPAAVRAVAVSADGPRLVSARRGWPVKLWTPATFPLREASNFSSGESPAEATPAFLTVSHSPDGSLLALATDDRTVQLRDARTGELRRTLAGHDDAVTCLAFAP